MRDEDFEIFIEEMGEATSSQEAPASLFDKYRHRLPDALLGYWESEGLGTYQNGLFRLVKPSDYEGLINSWVKGTPFELNDTYHVFGLSAFGDLYAWGETKNRKITVNTSCTAIIADVSTYDIPAANPNPGIQSFFALADPEKFDFEDREGEFLFERALRLCGQLHSDEIFGFEPMLPLGGSVTLENIRKVNGFVHMQILSDLGAASVPCFQNIEK